MSSPTEKYKKKYPHLTETDWYLLEDFFANNYSGNKPLYTDAVIADNFIKLLPDSFRYSPGHQYCQISPSHLKEMDVLRSYSRVDYIEDSLEYGFGDSDNDGVYSIHIQGAEIQTSVKVKNGYRIKDHCYILAVRLLDPRYYLEKPIRVIGDKNDRPLVKIGYISAGYFGALFFGYAGLTCDDCDDPHRALRFLYAGIEQLGAQIGTNANTLLVVMFILSYSATFYVMHLILGRNRVKMENQTFERRFDVYSKDQIAARMIFTPSFIRRIFDYTHKLGEKRKYIFRFERNMIYLKFDLKKNDKTFLNIRGKGVERYVHFYSEVRHIIQIIEMLNLAYYEKDLASQSRAH